MIKSHWHSPLLVQMDWALADSMIGAVMYAAGGPASILKGRIQVTSIYMFGFGTGCSGFRKAYFPTALHRSCSAWLAKAGGRGFSLA